MVAPVQLSQITAEWWSPKLRDEGQVVVDAADVNQAISIILTTYPGEDAHRPEFGSRLRDYIDYPINVASPNLVRESFEAIAIWEPRIVVDSITVTPVDTDISQTTISVVWRLIDSDIDGAVEVAF